MKELIVDLVYMNECIPYVCNEEDGKLRDHRQDCGRNEITAGQGNTKGVETLNTS